MKNGAPVHLHFGVDGHRKILERLRFASKVPATTSSQALAEAFHGLKQNAFCSFPPRKSVYFSRQNWRVSLSAEGIEIAAVEGIGGRQLQSFEKLGLTPAEIYQNALAVCAKHHDTDAVYIQSGTMATLGIIDELEQKIGKPIVSSNSVNIWGSLKPAAYQSRSGFRPTLEQHLIRAHEI